jgi:dsDNA-specific endonuclease/ATPase MutS2
MNFSLSRETVVVTNFSFDLKMKDVKELVALLESESGIELGKFKDVAAFLEKIKEARLEMNLFEVMKNCTSHEAHEEFRDGEEYWLYY